MMKYILVLLGIIVANTALRAEQLPEWYINLNEKGDSISQGKSILKIFVNPKHASVVVKDVASGKRMKVDTSFKSNDGSKIYFLKSGEYTVRITAVGYQRIDRRISLKSKYFVEAHANLYEEIEVDPIPDVNFKPVVYMYPQESTNIMLTIEPVGEFTFTYPLYNDGWKVLAHYDGTIEYSGKSYEYLFWEGTQFGYEIADGYGDCVAGSKTVAYLEDQLESYGLNYRERQDFITFWAPKLIENPYNYIVFLPGEMYDRTIATHKVDYSFDTTIKLHMLYQGMDYEIESHGQKAVSVKRSGSVYVEWGGAEYNALINDKL